MDFSKIDLSENQEIARAIIVRACSETFKERRDFEKFRNGIIKEYGARIFHNLYFVKAYNDLLEEGLIKENRGLLKFLQKRSVRTMSGVAPLTVMTKPFPCPGRCIYCPTDVRMPKSYLPSQPAAQRAFRQRFNPYTQVFVRLKALQMTGHEVSKVELRVIGGTWSSYPKRYQKWFLKQCLMAMNEFSQQISDKKTDKMENLVQEEDVISEYGVDRVNTVILKPLNGRKSFEDAVRENEGAKVRCIGINIETRPDFIDKNEAKRLRRLGVTKVEMGVQTVFDEIQKGTGRGHDLESVRKATGFLKDAGFKIGYHMMPNLPGSTPRMDKEMIKEIFENVYYKPDYLKIYPCVVMPKTKLSLMYRDGNYKSYGEKILEDILADNLANVPEWCRIDRIARDIPSNEIESGFRASNIRQILEAKLAKNGLRVREIRFREVKDEGVNETDVAFVERVYRASGGEERFLSFEDLWNDKILALLRLRFPGKAFIKELVGAAIVREVHVYGRQIAVGNKGKGEKQHLGLGRKLLEEAEKISRDAKFRKIAVISGIGTREYYRKWGYKLQGSYMLKSL